MKAKFGQTNTEGNVAVIILAVFLLLLIVFIPVGGYCDANQDEIRVKLTEVGKDTENFTALTKGSKFYKSMKHSEKLSDNVKSNSVIAVLAPWCGHCKRLKDSGMLEEVAKKIPVFVLDDKHPETPVVMGELQSNGFPTIGLLKDGKLTNYEGPRDASSLMDAMMS